MSEPSRDNGTEISAYGVTAKFWGQATITTVLLIGVVVLLVVLGLDRAAVLDAQHAAATEQQAAAVRVMTDQHREIHEQLEVLAYILTLDQKSRDALRLQEPPALKRLRSAPR